MLIRKLGLLCKFRAIVVLAVQLGIGQALLADDPQIRQIDRGLRLYNLLAAFVLAGKMFNSHLFLLIQLLLEDLDHLRKRIDFLVFALYNFFLLFQVIAELLYLLLILGDLGLVLLYEFILNFVLDLQVHDFLLQGLSDFLFQILLQCVFFLLLQLLLELVAELFSALLLLGDGIFFFLFICAKLFLNAFQLQHNRFKTLEIFFEIIWVYLCRGLVL